MLPQRLNLASTGKGRRTATRVGTTVGQYQITARVGGGGMGVVYKARDLKLDRSVALKFLPPQLERDETARRRLALEAQTGSTLSHRNVCTIHKLESTDDGQLFVVMAYYQGKTLKQKLEDGPLDVRQALNLAGQIAEGLAYVHGKEIVHGDIKPSNLMVAEDGIKILDFGLAMSAKAMTYLPSGSTISGTVAYTAPEQARGQRADSRSDIWSVGIVLYEMLAGHAPFRGEYPEAVSYAIRHNPTPALGPGIPPEVQQLVFKALEKDPKRRFQSARELAGQIRAVEAQLNRPAGEASRNIGWSWSTGKTLSHYRLTGPLGLGGMGVIYEAEDTRFPRRVALKFVSEDLADDSDAVRRLKREAETITELNHPNICSVYETTELEGRLCIVMERLQGMNLKLHMLRRPLETSEIVDIALQITDALEAAHEVGIVHRDIKPGNVFVDNSGFVKVLDFGLARRFRMDESDERSLEGSTMPGRPLGTANYMAPERVLQMPPDPRSDLFSLGVMIYEMATERLPFAGASSVETVINVFENDPTPIRKLSPGRPASLERLVNKLLAKRPGERYQSAAAVRRALQGVRPVTRSTRDRLAVFSLTSIGGRRGPIVENRFQLARAGGGAAERRADHRSRCPGQGRGSDGRRSAA